MCKQDNNNHQTLKYMRFFVCEGVFCVRRADSRKKFLYTAGQRQSGKFTKFYWKLTGSFFLAVHFTPAVHQQQISIQPKKKVFSERKRNCNLNGNAFVVRQLLFPHTRDLRITVKRVNNVNMKQKISACGNAKKNTTGAVRNGNAQCSNT